jgi:hypothetical protein
LNSKREEGLSARIETIERLLRTGGNSSSNSPNESIELKRQVLELKRSLKELKEAFVTEVPNPTESTLKTDQSSSSLVAQQLLKKVLIYEEQNSALKQEKKRMEDQIQSSNTFAFDGLNILYSIVASKYS